MCAMNGGHTPTIWLHPKVYTLTETMLLWILCGERRHQTNRLFESYRDNTKITQINRPINTETGAKNEQVWGSTTIELNSTKLPHKMALTFKVH